MARRKKILEENYDVNTTTEESHAEVETAGPETINGVISNASLVNVRSKPDLDSEVLEVLREGDKVVVLGVERNFYKVSTSVNKEVYIHGNYVKIKEV